MFVRLSICPDTAQMEKTRDTVHIYRLIFAQNVRQIRRLKEISQEDLAHAAGISRVYLGEVERGSRSVSIDVMGQIADALEVSLEQLLKRELIHIA